MEFGVLGPLTARRDGLPVELGTPKGRVLLAVLLCRRGRVVDADALVEAVWGDDPPKSAAKNVQTYVHRLRRRLGDPDRITRQGQGYLLGAGRHELDATRFEDLAAEARAASASGEHDRAFRLFGEALALWRGPAFAGFADVPVLVPEAARLDELRLGVREDRIDAGFRLGLHAELLGELTALTMDHPFRERMWAQLMRALHHCGRRADALLAYLRIRDVLAEETGLEPGRALQDLHRAILGSGSGPAPEPDPPRPPARAPRAEHERERERKPQRQPNPDRDQEQEQEKKQEQEQERAQKPEKSRAKHRAKPPGAAAPAEPRGPAARPAPVPRGARMLPPALDDFSGQGAELAGIEAVLRHVRSVHEPAGVVTVSGPGGSGKTALAVQAAHRLGSVYPDGQLFAALAGARNRPVDPVAVLGRFLRALGVPATAVPDDPQERAELYRGLLAERRILVVLDDAYDEEQVAPLMPASGTCGVLVTGRVRLGGLGGAHRVALREMSEADGLALLRNSTGGRLDRADPAELAELVRLCARLPLALRIVGSLLVSRPHWRPADLVPRLADARQRLDALRYRNLEVRASFGLSYEGLRPAARRLFRLLGLLEAPDVPLWAAAAALDTGPGEARDLLDELVDVHLLDVTVTPDGRARYGFHDLVRAYARERAEAEERPEDRSGAVVRVLGALLALTDIADRDHMGQNMYQRDAARWRPEVVRACLPQGAPPMTLLDPERLALVAGVRQAAELGRDELCWELAVGGHVLFETERYFDDWAECYATATGAAERAGHVRGRARLLISMAGLHYTRRRYGPAEECNTEAMELFARIEDRRGYLEALSNAPFFLVPNGRLTEAIAAGGEAYARLVAGGQPAAALHAYSQVGLAHLQADRPGAAAEVFAEIVAEARAQGIRTLVARGTYWLGQARLGLGRVADAEASFAELNGRAGDMGPSGAFYRAHAWGRLHAARGAYEAAYRRLDEAAGIARALHDPMFETRVHVDLLDPRLYAAEADGSGRPGLVEAITRGEHAVEVARGIHYPYLLAGVLDGLARLRAAAGDGAGASSPAGEAAAVRSAIR